MTPATRLKRLNQFLHMMENFEELFPDVELDCIWLGEGAEKPFTGCAITCAAAYPPFREQGLTLDRYGAPRYNGTGGTSAGMEFFDLSFDEACLISHNRKTTPQSYIKIIKKLIRKHSK